MERDTGMHEWITITLMLAGLANMPTKTADKERVGAVLNTLQAPDPA